MGPTFKIDGLASLVDQLRRHVPEEMRTRILRGAVGAAARLIRDEAIVRAPQYSGRVGANHPPPGTLKKAIYSYRVRGSAEPSSVEFLVTVRRGRKGGATPDAYYATWVEYGTVKMSARPFMRPAFEARKEEAVTVMRDYIAARITTLGIGARFGGG